VYESSAGAIELHLTAQQPLSVSMTVVVVMDTESMAATAVYAKMSMQQPLSMQSHQSKRTRFELKYRNQFNATTTEATVRTSLQLKTCYQNQNRESKKKLAEDKVLFISL